MKIKKPKYLDNKNYISILLIPFALIIIIINFIKNFSFKKKFKIKTVCVGNIYLGGTGKTSLCIEINKILKEFAENNNIDIIFSSNQMLIGKSSLDVTDDLLEQVNSKIKNFKIKK